MERGCLVRRAMAVCAIQPPVCAVYDTGGVLMAPNTDGFTSRTFDSRTAVLTRLDVRVTVAAFVGGVRSRSKVDFVVALFTVNKLGSRCPRYRYWQ